MGKKSVSTKSTKALQQPPKGRVPATNLSALTNGGKQPTAADAQAYNQGKKTAKADNARAEEKKDEKKERKEEAKQKKPD